MRGKDAPNHPDFCRIEYGMPGPVGTDIVDLFRIAPGVRHRQAHCRFEPVEWILGFAIHLGRVTSYLKIELGPASQGVLEVFQNQDASSFGYHSRITTRVVRPARRAWIRVGER